MKTIGFYMIARDEEELIARALESVKDADEIVVCVDDRTTDKTMEIAKRYTDKVYYFTWEDDFAKAKNWAASKCTTDWVCSIDADLFLEEGGMEKIKEVIQRTELQVVNMLLTPENRPDQNHERGKIYRNNGEIFYKGRAHEDLNILGKNDDKGVVIKMFWGYSKNHYKDPDRYVRILVKACAEEPENPRWRFYLAREFYYKKKWEIAIEMFKDYLKRSKFIAEKVEAYLHLSECYWHNQEGDKAREACLRAIQFNPDHKRALLLMASYHNEPWKSKWNYIASHATNKDVMFKKN